MRKTLSRSLLDANAESLVEISTERSRGQRSEVETQGISGAL